MMKNKIFTLSLLLVLPFLMSANHIEGKFTSTDHHVRVKIKDYRHGIKIKGLVSRHYVKFRYVRTNTYADYYGNMVKVVGPHKVVFRSSNWSDKISLYRQGHEPRIKYKRRNPGKSYGDNDWDEGNTYGRNNNTTYGRKFNSNESYINVSQLEGTWESKRPNKEVAILETRQGFKVKFSGDRKWTNFESTAQDNTSFSDRKGNKYYVISSNEMEWSDRKGNKIIRIRKISNDVRY